MSGCHLCTFDAFSFLAVAIATCITTSMSIFCKESPRSLRLELMDLTPEREERNQFSSSTLHNPRLGGRRFVLAHRVTSYTQPFQKAVRSASTACRKASMRFPRKLLVDGYLTDWPFVVGRFFRGLLSAIEPQCLHWRGLRLRWHFKHPLTTCLDTDTGKRGHNANAEYRQA